MNEWMLERTVISSWKLGFNQIIKSLLNLHIQTFKLPPSHSSSLYLIYSSFKTFPILKSFPNSPPLFFQSGSGGHHSVAPFWNQWSEAERLLSGSTPTNWNPTYQIGGNLQSSLLPWETGLPAFSSCLLLKHLLHRRQGSNGEGRNVTHGHLDLSTPICPKSKYWKGLGFCNQTWF